MLRVQTFALATVFFDIVSVGIVLPILPIFLHEQTASPFLAIVLFSLFPLCAFFSAPLLGALSDRFGRRPLLIFSLVGGTVGWGIMALFPTLSGISIGRAVSGFFAGNVGIAQSALSDISETKQERTASFGLVSATIGVAFVVGPAIGGVLSVFSIDLLFWLTTAISFVNTIGAVLFFPETKREFLAVPQKISVHPFAALLRSFRNTASRHFVISFFLLLLGISLFQAVFSLFSHLRFGLSERQTGFLFVAFGLGTALNQLVFMRRVWLRFFSEEQILHLFLPIVAALTFAFFFDSWIVFVVALVLLPVAQSAVRVVLLSEIAEATHNHARGEVLGVTQSLLFLASILSPPIGGWLLEFDLGAPWIFGGVLIAAAWATIVFSRYSAVSENR